MQKIKLLNVFFITLTMRVIISLKSLDDQPYEYEYHHHLQGFIYNLLRKSEYSYLHDKEGYKFFCMSNIFPVSELRRGDIRNLVVSSPSDGFIETIAMNLAKMSEVRVGCMRFKINGMRFIRHKIKEDNVRLITGTPIVIRIQRYRYKEYNIIPDKPYEYTFWRKDYPLRAFIKQLEENLLKKYKDFYGCSLEEALPLIQTLEFKKQVSTKIHFDEGVQTVIGTVWEFFFQGLSKVQKSLLEFGLEVGLGEMNSKGFGFTNIIKSK